METSAGKGNHFLYAMQLCSNNYCDILHCISYVILLKVDGWIDSTKPCSPSVVASAVLESWEGETPIGLDRWLIVLDDNNYYVTKFYAAWYWWLGSEHMRAFVEDKDVQLKFKEVCLSRAVASIPRTTSGDINGQYNYCSVLSKCPWVLKYNLQVWSTWALIPRIQTAYICIEAATLTPWNLVHERLLWSGRLPKTLW